MKNPTTPYSIGVQETFKITRSFLESQGWILKEEKPLFEVFTHKKTDWLECHIGLYGDFSITYFFGINRDPERYFCTVNKNLTEDDYFTIIRLLNFDI